MLFLYILVAVCVVLDAQQEDDLLPQGWEKICTTTEPFIDWDPEPPSFNWSQPIIQISCQIENSEVLTLADLRDWSWEQKQPIALNVLCSKNASGFLRFPWPMLSPNLVYLKIIKCHIKDYYNEFLHTHSNLTQELRVFIMEDTIKDLSTSQIAEFAENMTQISRDSHCLSVLLEKYVSRNNSINPILDTSWQVFMKVSTQYIKSFQLVTHKCDYNFLHYMDESNSKYKGSLFFQNELYKGSFPELRFFNLSNMGFITIPEELNDWRFHYPKMQYLDLSWNSFSTFFFMEYSSDDQGVGIIDLRHNNISELSELQLNRLSLYKTVVIDLRDNPLSCECDSSKDMHRLFLDKSDSFLPQQLDILSNMTCAFPDILVGSPFGSLLDEDLTCLVEDDSANFVILVSMMGLVVALAVAMGLFVFYYRREISVLLFTKFGIIFSRGCPEGKDFDAFISYSSRDDSWVISTLVKRLESGEKCPAFKLCVHHRDFEVGAAIADNVVTSVESSRHTVLVLSKNYIKSEWCIYEFRTAMHQSLIEKRKHMIIIILETVPKEELEADLRKCLETFTYITVGDKLFWNKLIYSLSCGKPRTSSVTDNEANC